MDIFQRMYEVDVPWTACHTGHWEGLLSNMNEKGDLVAVPPSAYPHLFERRQRLKLTARLPAVSVSFLGD